MTSEKRAQKFHTDDASSGLGSASSCRMGKLIHPIRSTTQIWVLPRHQYGISVLVSQTSFCGETSGAVANCRLFSQASDLHYNKAKEKAKTKSNKILQRLKKDF